VRMIALVVMNYILRMSDQQSDEEFLLAVAYADERVREFKDESPCRQSHPTHGRFILLLN